MVSYEKALDLWELSYLKKTAAKLIEDLEIRQTGTLFIVSMFVKAMPQFKIEESYRFRSSRTVARRDLRGEALASAKMTSNGIELVATFGGPLSGRLEEQYVLLSPGQLRVSSTVEIKGKTVESILLYTKAQ